MFAATALPAVTLVATAVSAVTFAFETAAEEFVPGRCTAPPNAGGSLRRGLAVGWPPPAVWLPREATAPLPGSTPAPAPVAPALAALAPAPSPLRLALAASAAPNTASTVAASTAEPALLMAGVTLAPGRLSTAAEAPAGTPPASTGPRGTCCSCSGDGSAAGRYVPAKAFKYRARKDCQVWLGISFSDAASFHSALPAGGHDAWSRTNLHSHQTRTQRTAHGTVGYKRLA